MKAVWLEEQKLSIRDISPPASGGSEALVRVRLAGICGTDLELIRGYYPYRGVLGHEFVGEVISAPGRPALDGHRVVGEINASCGSCPNCRSGRPTHCENRTVLGIVGRDGAFAEYLRLPVDNLHMIPDDLPDQAAVFTEPVAAALEILEQVHIRPADRVLLVGAGRLGLLIAQTLQLTGCGLDVVVRRPERQARVAAFGVRTVGEDEWTAGAYDIAVEATGSGAGFQVARQALRPRGTLVLKSTYAGAIKADFSSIVVDEITLVGSRCGPFQPAIKMLAERRIKPLDLIEAEYSLDQALEAFEEAKKRGVLKVLLRPER